MKDYLESYEYLSAKIWTQMQQAIDMLYIYKKYYLHDSPTVHEIRDAWVKVSGDSYVDWIDYTKMEEKKVADLLHSKLHPGKRITFDDDFIVGISKAVDNIIGAIGSNNVNILMKPGKTEYIIENDNVKVTLTLEQKVEQ